MQLLTIEQLRSHCRADPSDDDLLTVYAEAAEQAAQDFLNRKVYPDVETMAEAVEDGTAGDDPAVLNPAIRAAILLSAAHLYRNREGVGSEQLRELPMGVRQLLWPHRVGLGI